MMLLISFYAVATACVLLYLELKMYGDKDWWDTTGSQPNAAPTAPAPAGHSGTNAIPIGDFPGSCRT